MKADLEWTEAPAQAYRRWQEAEAVGSARRPFSARSIVQHTAMFERFARFLRTNCVTVASFGEDHLESFIAELGRMCAPGTSTALRYAKLLDRLCRHLVDIGVRADNPANAFARHGAWPTTEPVPLFLDEAADLRLQAYVQPASHHGARDVRNMAVVALLHATGVTSAELRRAQRMHVVADGTRPHIVVAAHKARGERIVPLAPFALAPLQRWLRAKTGDGAALLFPLEAATGSLSEDTLWRIVRDALEATGFDGADMSPRVLRNTFARRMLLAGRSNEDASRLLGLVSHRTVVRLRATIPAPDTPT
ncbi:MULTISPECIES: tyrosine-type recombinase/integrase [Burkholderia]|uniref:Tyrosine recombinase XerD n=1 Tax=Burkholderia pseudomultivorans TaxID=1207504 RepID=A0ABU2ECC4_9BURK|nr:MULTISPECIES: site-specific integrase [Burkholderia]MDR8731453.1 Tyrosine recombinase XerD [Burkholderia pseudomultivorans]MDR8738782.1 Tyrosine recombinase XerD [Burkholderia pseudomultivorans]MDR8745385.1 Tyrosine recombinase XerD [Burkholderia pseudomultivorans]MDR8757522.1 Tyrosine recombinase XerD [Burkholderia pseudomultivorans]MDR8781630.1 Tyrosine recombinase XerD [Burkholderia pseudomultivorans]